MIQEQLAHLPEFLPDYRPFPPVKEHTAWQGLPLRAKQRFLQAGEAALQTPIAPLPLSLWLDFTHTGRRTPWETAYFSRRARLCALVSAECVEHKGRFLDEIADTVWAICEESAWQLPAHNSYVRDTPAAAPAGHHPPHRGFICRRDRRASGADPVLTAR